MKNIAGNYYQKHKSNNPIVKYLMNSFHSTLFDLIDDVNPGNILDVGCGEGYTVEEINKRFPNIIIEGSDLESEVIALAKKNLSHINFKVESACDLQRSDKSFDLVTMLEVLEHIENPDDAIEEAKRVSKKHCIFSVPFEPYWRILNVLRLKYLMDLGNTPGHINHWSRFGFERLLKNHFNVVRVRTVFP
ncbi:MAG: methyltransferase domain-containing protein, partial [Candidatus Dadabacteria bacterium]|nr:methyltransferase domain-containing protein [Candidatus Dadabacteria bacterium]